MQTKAQTRELALIRAGRYTEIRGRVTGHGMNADGTMWIAYGARGWSGRVTVTAEGEVGHE